MTNQQTDTMWVVFRCAGKETLDLAQKARDAGCDVFAPARTVKVRIPRRHLVVNKDYPVLASFLFVSCEGDGWAKAREAFSEDAKEMVIRGAYVTVSGEEVMAMRDHIIRVVPAARTTKKSKPEPWTRSGDAPKFNINDRVRIDLGPFANLSGVITNAFIDECELDLGSIFGKVRISTFLLSADEAYIKES